MPSARDYVVRARQKLRIHADEEPLESHELDKGIDALTDLLTGWVGDGTILSFYGLNTSADVVVVTLLDSTTWTFEANNAIIANLALRLADDYGKAVTPQIAKDAMDGVSLLATKGLAGLDRQSQFDPALSYMPSQRRVSTYDGSA